MGYLSRSKLEEDILDAYKSHDKTKDRLVIWGVSVSVPQDIEDIQQDDEALVGRPKLRITNNSEDNTIVAQIDEMEIRQFIFNLKNRFNCTKDVIFQVGKLIIPKQDYTWIDGIIEKKRKQRRSIRLVDMAMGNYMKEVVDFYDD